MLSSYEATSDASDGVYADSGENAVNILSAVTKKVAKRAKTVKAERPVEEVYQKKTQLEHILLRPDTYIGSVERIEQSMWVYDDAGECMVHRPLSFVPGFFKIFDEILVNAADNKVRDPTGMDCLKVDIDKEGGVISVHNNGRGIPIVVHGKEGVYVPELIFGHLLTSSNYDDATKKVTGGRNGYGAKLCNIFSREFIVETADSSTGKKYRQVFKSNMSKREDPVISNWTKEDYTKITFKPDLAKFGMSAMDDDIIALFKKRVYDMAGVCRDVKVFLNGDRIKVKGFKQYVELYLKPSKESEEHESVQHVVHEIAGERWEVACAVSDGQFQQVSFVNSINTCKGGTHVGHVSDQIVNEVIAAATRKNKSLPLKPFQVKNHLFLFINCQIENPAFDSQTKENMTLPVGSFGSRCALSEEFMKKLLKSGILETVLNFARFKQDQQLKKTDGTKKCRLAGIPKLDDANMAGTRSASKCTLILTEGDSAKALAVSGLSVIGRDYYGVFPLRGKLLNVRDAPHKSIMDNVEISSLKQILGLQHGKVYESVDSLRYGRIMIMTDQDHDGSHIKGLIINLLDHFWPSLLRIPGFLTEFITPIVKCWKGKHQEVSFFTLPEYEQWRRENDDGRGWTVKYYKGLGTSTAADAKKYFSDMSTHLKEFAAVSDTERSLINMAFSKKLADHRKAWLREYQPGTFMDHSADRLQLSDFINRELILFSLADNVRSIPSVVDGLKPGHRKILFSCFKRRLRGEIKVAQLAGYIGEHSAYHHGEQSLCTTIVGMAQDFVGSNNMHLLEPIGQFGTRLQGGKDAASSRYIFTSLSPVARLLYRQEDDAILKYLNDDGQSIEPEWYIPVIPMVLVNGGEGIGTGWSTSIPNYNPSDVITNVRRLLDGLPMEPMTPWWRGFKGLIEPAGSDRCRVTGLYNVVDDCTFEITELPIGSWTQPYKELLEGWLSGDDKTPAFIRDYKEYHSERSVRFVITLSPENMAAVQSEGIEKRFRLSTFVSTGNLVCFDANGRIKRYSTPEQILSDHYEIRLGAYQRRKAHLTDHLTAEWSRADNKCRFIRAIVDGQLIVQKRKKAEVVAELRRLGYSAFASIASASSEGADLTEGMTESESPSTSDKLTVGYDYLLNMPIHSLTLERVTQLEAEKAAKEAELNALLKKTAKDLWREDLDALEAKWTEACAADEEAVVLSTTSTQGKPKKPKQPPKKKNTTSPSVDSIDEPSIVETKPKKTTVNSTQPASAAVRPTQLAAKATTQPATTQPEKKQVSLDTFTRPIAISDDDLDLPLAERISRMLAGKSTPAIAKPVTLQPPTQLPKPASLPSKPRAPATKKRTVVMSSDDDCNDDDVYSDDSDDAYSEG